MGSHLTINPWGGLENWKTAWRQQTWWSLPQQVGVRKLYRLLDFVSHRPLLSSAQIPALQLQREKCQLQRAALKFS